MKEKDKNELIACQDRINPYIHRTPILTSTLINEMFELDLYFKCENFQKMGAFKMRGALNAILKMSEAEKANGVVTHSSGNFAQAIALAAKNSGIKAYIVMPKNAPEVKKAAVRGYGGNVVESEPTIESREEMSQQIMDRYGATFIHPSNNYDVIIGQGSAALELLQDMPEIKTIICPVGGGGLLAGSALAARHFGNDVKVYGVEPEAVDDAYRSLNMGEIQTNKPAFTIADGLRTVLGDINFPIIQENVERIILVSENEIIQAMRLVWERMKIIIEPSSAVAVAGAIRNKDLFQNNKVGVIISGGNVDLSNLPF